MPEIGNSAVFSQTDGSNNSGTMPSWSGSAAPSTLDDAGRAFQGAVTREWNWRNYTLTAGGTADAKTLTYSVAPAAYYNGQRFAFIANTVNATTTPTLNVNALGAVTIKKVVNGALTALAAGDMIAGSFVEVAYNSAGTCFVWVNQAPSGQTVDFGAGAAATPSITTVGDLNTGFWFPAADTIAASTGGSERIRIDSSGQFGIGGTPTVKLDVQNATGTISIYSRTGDGSVANMRVQNTSGSFGWYIPASTNAVALFDYNAGVERFRCDSAGNLLNVSTGGLGYGTGAGGTVTQITSKLTGVTLNTTCGQITMNSAALAANTTVSFVVTNSKVAATDTIITHPQGGAADTANYTVRVRAFAAGSFTVSVRNESAGSLSEALVINFAVIKAVNA